MRWGVLNSDGSITPVDYDPEDESTWPDDLRAQVASQSQNALAAPRGDGVFSALAGGAKRTAGALGTTANVLMGDEDAIRASAAEPVQQTPAQERFHSALQGGEDDSFWSGVKNVAGAVRREPRGAMHEMAAQFPNSAVVLSGMAAGAKIGALATPVNPVVGAIVGGIGGMLAGTFGVEAGFLAPEKMRSGEYDRGEVIRQAGIKTGVIGAADVASLGINRWFFGAPGRAASKAVSEALDRAGLDPSDMSTLVALRDNPVLAQQIREAGQQAALAATPSGIKALPGYGRALALESSAEAFGEYGGSLAAGLDASWTEAVLEGAMAAPQSLIETGVSKAFAKKPDAPGTQPGQAETVGDRLDQQRGTVPDQKPIIQEVEERLNAQGKTMLGGLGLPSPDAGLAEKAPEDSSSFQYVPGIAQMPAGPREVSSLADVGLPTADEGLSQMGAGGPTTSPGAQGVLQEGRIPEVGEQQQVEPVRAEPPQSLDATTSFGATPGAPIAGDPDAGLRTASPPATEEESLSIRRAQLTRNDEPKRLSPPGRMGHAPIPGEPPGSTPATLGTLGLGLGPDSGVASPEERATGDELLAIEKAKAAKDRVPHGRRLSGPAQMGHAPVQSGPPDDQSGGGGIVARTRLPSDALTKKDGDPFASERAVRAHITSAGYNPDEFDIAPVSGGFVALPKRPDTTTEAAQTPAQEPQQAEPIPAQGVELKTPVERDSGAQKEPPSALLDQPEAKGAVLPPSVSRTPKPKTEPKEARPLTLRTEGDNVIVSGEGHDADIKVVGGGIKTKSGWRFKADKKADILKALKGKVSVPLSEITMPAQEVTRKDGSVVRVEETAEAVLSDKKAKIQALNDLLGCLRA